MLLHCPSCSTGYDIPDRCRGRRLRCAHCSAEWRPSPPEAEPHATPDPVPSEVDVETELVVDDEPVVEEDPERVEDGTRDAEPEHGEQSPARRYRPVLALSACWMLSLSIMGGSAYAAVHWRDAISHRWPPSQRVYALIPTA